MLAQWVGGEIRFHRKSLRFCKANSPRQFLEEVVQYVQRLGRSADGNETSSSKGRPASACVSALNPPSRPQATTGWDLSAHWFKLSSLKTLTWIHRWASVPSRQAASAVKPPRMWKHWCELQRQTVRQADRQRDREPRHQDVAAAYRVITRICQRFTSSSQQGETLHGCDAGSHQPSISLIIGCTAACNHNHKYRTRGCRVTNHTSSEYFISCRWVIMSIAE